MGRVKMFNNANHSVHHEMVQAAAGICALRLCKRR